MRRTDRSTGLSSNFRERADSAAFFEAWVGAVLARAGLYTVHHPFTLAKDPDDIATYAETWDLDVSADDPKDMADWSTGTRVYPVEVKSSNLTFHNVDTYPFDDLLVCSQNSWEKKWVKAARTMRDFLFVSRQTGAILWLPKGSGVTLGHDVYDRTRNQTYKAVRAESCSLLPLDAFVSWVKTDGH